MTNSFFAILGFFCHCSLSDFSQSKAHLTFVVHNNGHEKKKIHCRQNAHYCGDCLRKLKGLAGKSELLRLLLY